MSDGGKKLEPSTILGGRYRIERVLGRGGMGAVYEATRVDLDRRVAIKLLDEAVDAPQEALAATEREARALAKLAHPHIVQIIDFSRGDDGPPFFVMELLAGESLDTRLRRAGKIAPGTAALVMVQVLSALGAAHAAEILHRDVKPANVFLTPTAAGFDFVKLLDFGIAGNLSTHATASVRGAALMGTPSYMAPEQIRGDRLGPRTDVWGAGVCLYEMLTDTLPFDGENIAALLASICNFTPLPLVGIEPGLAAIVQRAMAKDPAARFASAEAMRAALAPFAAIGAVPSREFGQPQAIEGAVTVPAFAEAPPTMSNEVMPLAATVPDPSTPRDREAYASTAMSAPRMGTLASGSARTFDDVPSPPSLGWLPIANGALALVFIGLVGFTLVPRRGAPLAATSTGAPTCGFARIRTWGEGLVDLRIAAGPQGMLLAGSTGKPSLQYATLDDVDAPFDDWTANLYGATIAPTERVFPCASFGRQPFGGGLRERPIDDGKGGFWTTVARFPRPNGQGLFGVGGRMDSANMEVTNLDCAAVDDLTVIASVGPYRGPDRPDLYLDVADGPRKELRSSSIDFPTRVRIDAAHEGFGRLVIENETALVTFIDFHTLQGDPRRVSSENADPNEGDVAITDGEVEAVWIEQKPRAIHWSRHDRALENQGTGVLAEGDVFSVTLAHGGPGVAIAWGDRLGDIVRIHVGQGRTARDAARAALPLEVGRDARNIVVAASGDRPWVAWLEGGVAQTTRLACRK